jgi:hypothetical protein
MARRPRKKSQAQEEPPPTVLAVQPSEEVDEVTEQQPETLETFVQETHGQMDKPQAGYPNIGWFKDNFETKSGAIRYAREVLNMDVKVISKHLGIRYQMVRNVVNARPKRGANEPLVPKSERLKPGSVPNPSNIPPKIPPDGQSS